ncbi:MAG: hypothetical protein IV093_18675 [Rubrivivax sp.]|nr:hypothetical protein [Rubrivivax sp.]
MSCTALRWPTLALLGLGLAGASAAEGLQTPEAGSLWPRWQARVTLVLTEPGPGSGTRTLRQASVLGDYYLHSHGQAATARWRGGFRATSGMVFGPAGVVGAQADEPAAARDADLWPYIGLGYTGLAPRSGWGFSADLGLGLRGWEGAMRQVDLTPMLQLGVRYSF